MGWLRATNEDKEKSQRLDVCFSAKGAILLANLGNAKATRTQIISVESAIHRRSSPDMSFLKLVVKFAAGRRCLGLCSKQTRSASNSLALQKRAAHRSNDRSQTSPGIPPAIRTRWSIVERRRWMNRAFSAPAVLRARHLGRCPTLALEARPSNIADPAAGGCGIHATNDRDAYALLCLCDVVEIKFGVHSEVCSFGAGLQLFREDGVKDDGRSSGLLQTFHVVNIAR